VVYWRASVSIAFFPLAPNNSGISFEWVKAGISRVKKYITTKITIH